MQPADLRRSVRKSPFRPFKLRLTDGREFDFDDPHRWCVGSGQTFAALADKRPGFVILTADQIAEVVYLAPKPKGGE